MHISDKVKKILSYYESDTPGTKTNLAKILMHGKLAGTGKMVILPVDQGFEHGPARSFAMNPVAYDPEYHINLAIDFGLSAYAAPLGMLETIASSYAGSIPLILKANSANSLTSKNNQPYQAITASVPDALRLGCSAIGFTIYPGSDNYLHMIEEISEISREAKACGLAVIIWSYPRGGDISKEGDVISYAAHMAALIGAHIIKVKPPTKNIEIEACKKIYSKHYIKTESLADRVSHVMESAFQCKRLVVFSGGATKTDEDIYAEIKSIRNGGGSGSIIGRNTFQRSYDDAKKLLSRIIDIYLNKA